MTSASDYWQREALDKLVALYTDEAASDPYYATSGAVKTAFAPQVEDLVRLHRLVRSRMSTTVLEFGVGFSTVVLADALAKNEADYKALPAPPPLRNRNAFRLFSVDASEHWLGETRKRIPEPLRARTSLHFSAVRIGTFNGRLCHYYDQLPNIVPDFIYLDGPLPKDVQGSINGLDFSVDERTVMAADILLMESTLLPGTTILVDGRVNNARFLQRNFQRPFRCHYDATGDVTIFELDEPPLGRHSHDLAGLVARHRKGA